MRSKVEEFIRGVYQMKLLGKLRYEMLIYNNYKADV